ncbi:MAG: hypothetical protein FWF82_04670, partial [Oscillospiraceae bacterium]|nr:hypothetical protein [Oscillospiraceae bacterium]
IAEVTIENTENTDERVTTVSILTTTTVTTTPPPIRLKIEPQGTAELGTVLLGYEEPPSVEIEISNYGILPTEEDLTIELYNNSEKFILSADSLGIIEAGGSLSFTVTPIAGLEAGWHGDTLIVSGGGFTLVTQLTFKVVDPDDPDEIIKAKIIEAYGGDELSFIRCFGIFNGYEVVSMWTNPYGESSHLMVTVDGYDISPGSTTSEIFVFTGEDFVQINEAYEVGLLRLDDIIELNKLYKERFGIE